MTGLLAPYRVLDLTDERGAFAGLLLAQLGADVVLVEPPGGCRTRRVPPFLDDIPGPNRSLVHLTLNRGKRTIEARGDQLLSLVGRADVILTSGGPAELSASRIPSFADLAAANPGIVMANVSGFGLSGPKADWSDGDLVCAAAGLQLSVTGDADRPPLRCAVPQVFASASADAAVGVLLALAERTRSGRGQLVDCSAQESWIWAGFYLAYASPWGAAVSHRDGAAPRTGPLSVRFDFPAADGHVTITLLFGGAVGPYTNRLVAWMVEESECPDDLAATDWVTFDATRDPERMVRLNDAVGGFTSRRTKADLLAQSRARRLLLAPAVRLDEVLASEQFAVRELWRPLVAGGRTASIPGPFARCSPVPLTELTPAPLLGTRQEWRSSRGGAASTSPSPGVAADGAPVDGLPLEGLPLEGLPLEGLKVLDLTTSFAGPLVGRTLAVFGARVVKVESEQRPDFARTTGPFLHASIDGSASYAHTNAEKWSLSLDLSKPASRPVLDDLVRWADVIIDAYAPGALARMGLDPEALDRLNPSIVLLQTTMLGQTGPFADMPGYGNMAGALCGFFTTTAWPDRAPVGPVGAYTDMVSPRFALAALLAALDHRRRTGQGTRIDLGQGEACLHLLSIGLADTQLNRRAWEHRGNRDWFSSPHGVFPSRGDDCWVALSCPSDDAWRALASLLGRADLAELDTDERLARVEEIDALVGAWTRQRDPRTTEQQLQRLGIPAHGVQNSPECSDDPQLAHRGWVVPARHSILGDIAVGGSPIRLSRTPARTAHAGPAMGEHTSAVLAELLGYDDDRIAELAIADVLR